MFIFVYLYIYIYIYIYISKHIKKINKNKHLHISEVRRREKTKKVIKKTTENLPKLSIPMTQIQDKIKSKQPNKTIFTIKKT